MKTIKYTDHQVNGFINDILRQMWQHDYKPDYVVGITRGGLIPALKISQYLDVPMHTLNVSFRDDNHTESKIWMAEEAFGYDREKRKILIVDDINDSGATLNWIKEDWQSGCEPNNIKWNDIWNKNVRFAVLIDNENSAFEDVDFVGTTVNKLDTPCWCQFPWEEWWK